MVNRESSSPLTNINDYIERSTPTVSGVYVSLGYCQPPTKANLNLSQNNCLFKSRVTRRKGGCEYHPSILRI